MYLSRRQIIGLVFVGIVVFLIFTVLVGSSSSVDPYGYGYTGGV